MVSLFTKINIVCFLCELSVSCAAHVSQANSVEVSRTKEGAKVDTRRASPNHPEMVAEKGIVSIAELTDRMNGHI